MTRQLDVVIATHPKDFPTLDPGIECVLEPNSLVAATGQGLRRVPGVRKALFPAG